MPKITAWKCPFTDKLFQTRSGYRRHLLSLRKKRKVARYRHKLARISRERINKVRSDMDAKLAQIRTAEQLEKFVVENFHDLTIAHTNASIEKVAVIRQMKMEWFEFERIIYSSETSNSHNCPRNGTTNWGGRKEGAPRNYPGFSGQMKWKVTGPKSAKNIFSDGIEAGYALNYAGIHTTTGCPGWDGNIGFQFFVDDFPGLGEEVKIATEKAKKEIFKARLKNPNRVVNENDIINKHIRPIHEKQT